MIIRRASVHRVERSEPIPEPNYVDRDPCPRCGTRRDHMCKHVMRDIVQVHVDREWNRLIDEGRAKAGNSDLRGSSAYGVLNCLKHPGDK